MREALKNAVHNAILLECKLPHQESGLDKSCLSSQNDICFSNSKDAVPEYPFDFSGN